MPRCTNILQSAVLMFNDCCNAVVFCSLADNMVHLFSINQLKPFMSSPLILSVSGVHYQFFKPLPDIAFRKFVKHFYSFIAVFIHFFISIFYTSGFSYLLQYMADLFMISVLIF